MTLLVTGGRHYGATHEERLLLADTLNAIHAETPITLLIHGDASGADRLADTWAKFARVPRRAVVADWRLYGKQAGFVRNAEMVRMKPDLVVAFPGGRGTADCTRKAQAAGIPVRMIS